MVVGGQPAAGNTVWRKCLTVQNFDEWSSQ